MEQGVVQPVELTNSGGVLAPWRPDTRKSGLVAQRALYPLRMQYIPGVLLKCIGVPSMVSGIFLN